MLNYRYMFDKQEDYLEMILLFKGLDNIFNFKILKVLNIENTLSVNDLAKKMNVDQYKVSRHVSQMEKCGLVVKNRCRHKILISINITNKMKLHKIYEAFYEMGGNGKKLFI